jgi:hypothetical protein
MVMISSPSSKCCVSGTLGLRFVVSVSVVHDVQEGPCLQCIGLGTLLLRRMVGAVVAVGSGGSSPKAVESLVTITSGSSTISSYCVRKSERYDEGFGLTIVGKSVGGVVTVTEGVTGRGDGGRGVTSGAA